MIKTVIFDLDGTLLNTFNDLADAVNSSLTLNGLQPYTTDKIKTFVGNGIKRLIENALNNQSALFAFQKVFDDFCRIYQANCKIKTKPYNGINEILNELKKKNIKLAVLTNKHHLSATEIIEYYFPNTFDLIVGQDNRPLKPDPTSVFYIAKTLKTALSNIVMIGDSNVDIATARNADIKSIGVFWGYENINLIADADYIAYTSTELLDIILSIK